MFQRATIVRIPTPCSESWDKMVPTGAGRHCASCQKVVVDFTQKTDAEILAALLQLEQVLADQAVSGRVK